MIKFVRGRFCARVGGFELNRGVCVIGEPNPDLLPPRFRDDSTQCVIGQEGGATALRAELYDIGRNTEIVW